MTGATLALLGLCLATKLAAQSSDQRRALDAYRDSLSSVSDTLSLLAEESRLVSTARKTRGDPFMHLRLGQLALRQADLGGSSHFNDAASEFKWTTELAPQWPYAWFGLGLAEYALGNRTEGRADRAILARDAWTRAADAFARAAALEPAFAPRLEELARQALRSGSQERALVIMNALKGAVRGGALSREGRLYLALGRVQREMGDSEAAGSFRAFVSSGEEHGLALLELGRSRLLNGDLAGTADYFEGLASDQPGAVIQARSDFQPIATDAELADFDFRRGTARADMVRRFWTTRDRVELRPAGSRLAEHLRRLGVARRDFALVGDDGVELLDDRGRIFIRHGEPDDRASFAIPGVEPNESWRYRRAGADMVLHFAARQDPRDFHLIESLLDVSDMRPGMGIGGGTGTPGAVATGAQLLRSRSALAPLYRQLPIGSPSQVADYLSRERDLGRRGIQLATRTDSYSLHFPIELDAWGEFAVGGGSGSEPVVQVLFAIPGYAIEPATGTAGIVYPVRVRFVALDTAGNIVASVDTVTNIEPGDRIPSNRSLLGHVAVPVRPGRLTVQAAVQYGDQAGSAFGVDSVTVPSPGAGVLALGDLLIGTGRGKLKVQLGDGRDFALAPGGVVHRSDGIALAIEVFGMAPSEEVSLRVYLAPRNDELPPPAPVEQWKPFPGGSGKAVVRRVPGGDPIARWRTTLSLGRLKPGSWWLAVVASDSAGRQVRRESRLEVLLP